MDFLYGTWHWAISGFLLGIIMLLLVCFGKTFGISSNLRTLCSIAGAGKVNSFFAIDWQFSIWNLIIVAGSVFGGMFAGHYLMNGTELQLSPETLTQLQSLGISLPNGTFAPESLFGMEAIGSVKGFLILLGGGFLIGFGTRYAGGCTSGHAITGLSNLQMPSLIAVIGFFIGGLLMSYFILPLLL